ncbi:hypothetical protein CR513_59930, partial [Mucuna pruriens]
MEGKGHNQHGGFKSMNSSVLEALVIVSCTSIGIAHFLKLYKPQFVPVISCTTLKKLDLLVI